MKLMYSMVAKVAVSSNSLKPRTLATNIVFSLGPWGKVIIRC